MLWGMDGDMNLTHGSFGRARRDEKTTGDGIMEMMWPVPVIAAICGGILASNKNRSVVGWVLLCLLLPICIVILLCLSPLPARAGEQSSAAGSMPAGPMPDEKTCPYCAETVKAAAIVCKHCGKDIPPAQVDIVQPAGRDK